MVGRDEAFPRDETDYLIAKKRAPIISVVSPRQKGLAGTRTLRLPGDVGEKGLPLNLLASRLNVLSSSQCYVGKTNQKDQGCTCHDPHDDSRNQVISNHEKNQSEKNYWTSHTERDLGFLLAKDVDDSYAAHYSDQRSYDGHKVQLTTCCPASSVDSSQNRHGCVELLFSGIW